MHSTLPDTGATHIRLRSLTTPLLAFPLLLAGQGIAPAPTWPTGRTVQVFQDSAGLVVLQRMASMPITLTLDVASGRVGALLPESGDTTRLFFVEGGGRVASRERMILRGAGDDIRLTILDGSRTRVGTPIPLHEEELTIANGDVSLAGRFVRPAAADRYPVVLFLHGSGGADRGMFVSWGGMLAANGIASFSYDKRGTGASTGDWQTSTLRELASDATAIVAALRGRSDVAPERVALLGTSQGPWVAAIVAAADPRIAAVIYSSGGGVSGGEQEIFRRVGLVAASGASASEVELARNIITHYFRYLASGGTDSVGISGYWRDYSATAWFQHLSMPTKDPTVGTWPKGRTVFAMDLALDHAGDNHRITVPVLQLLSKADEGIPAERASALLRGQLPHPAEQLTSRIFEGSDHRFNIPATEPDDAPRFHPDYFPTIVNWLCTVLHPEAPHR
ncbi:MAG: alpha/beta hydrolase [Gemmatimonadota bacterium]